MMLAPEKRTKFDFLNYAKSSAILCMATSGFEPRSTRTTRRSETRYACRSPTAFSIIWISSILISSIIARSTSTICSVVR